jgi:cell wall-associated NlpC family hydrolase
LPIGAKKYAPSSLFLVIMIKIRCSAMVAGAFFFALSSSIPTAASGQEYLKRLLETNLPRSEASISVEEPIVTLARAQVGARYRWGGERPETGFDCSGLMRHVLKSVGIELPRTSAEQARIGESVPRDPTRLIPGDILTFGRGSRISHVGIYIGDGRYVHASSRRGYVTEDRIANLVQRGSTWWKGARRVMVSQAGDDDRDSSPAS